MNIDLSLLICNVIFVTDYGMIVLLTSCNVIFVYRLWDDGVIDLLVNIDLSLLTCNVIFVYRLWDDGVLT